MIIFGSLSTDVVPQYIILYAIYFVCKIKFFTNSLSLVSYINYFFKIYEVGKCVSAVKGNVEIFERMWLTVKQYFEADLH